MKYAGEQLHPLLQIKQLAIGYQTPENALIQILHGIDLTVERGETIGIVGESGSGKSTVALAMMGYLRRGSRVLRGTVTFQSQDLFSLAPTALQTLRGGKIALIPQNAGQWLTPNLRIGQQLEETLRLHTKMTPQARQKRLHELLGHVHLPQPAQLAQRYPHQLSGGQQQRVAIAMALAGEPELLILDEPTTGLDVTTQAHILTLLREVAHRSGVAMVYVSHDWSVIAQVSDRAAVMYAGEIVEVGATAQILTQPHHPYTRGLLAAIPQLHGTALPAAIPGTPPALGSVTSGCAFAPRCTFVDHTCQQHPPALVPIADHRPAYQVRCHHWTFVATTAKAAANQPPRLPTHLPTHTPLLQVDGVQISYHPPLFWRKWGAVPPNPRATVHDFSLTIDKGETLALVGESGSGKSTVVRAIAGLLAPQRGTIQLAGTPLLPKVDQRQPLHRRQIQMIFQNPDTALNPRHTVAQLLAQPLRLYFRLGERAIRARSLALLEQVRLGATYLTRFPGQLSGGEKQRIAIARAFAAEPDLVLCDEVVAALDVSVQAAVLDLLVRLQAERGVAYLFIAHDLAVVRTIADRVAVLYQGQLCEVGTTEQVYAPPHHPYTALLLQSATGAAVSQDATNGRPPHQQGAGGCPVQTICPRYLGRRCAEVPPPWQTTPAGHRIRCHIPLAELAETSNH